MTEWLLRSDIAAALTAALFKHSVGLPGTMYMDALKAGVFSSLARVLPGKVVVNVGSLTNGQKSQILIGLLAAAEALYKKNDPLGAAVAYTAIDCLSLELMSILGIADASLLGA
jgi:hypothetical protein